MRRFRNAFTLVEILMVVVIIGIAAAVIVPNMSSRNDLKAAAAARVVMSDLMYAQNLAITRQQAYYVTFDVTNQTYMVVASSAMTTPITQPISKGPYVVRFGNNGTPGLESSLASVDLRGSGTTPYLTVGFDELGTPVVYTGIGSDQALTSGSITVQSGDYKLRVDIEAYTGQISATQVH